MAEIHRLGAVTQIPHGEGRTFEVAGRRVAVFRGRGGQVYATQADCPHRGGPLSDGLLGGTTLVCPLHEWRFDLLTGRTENGDCPIDVYPMTLDSDGTMVITIP